MSEQQQTVEQQLARCSTDEERLAVLRGLSAVFSPREWSSAVDLLRRACREAEQQQAGPLTADLLMEQARWTFTGCDYSAAVRLFEQACAHYHTIDNGRGEASARQGMAAGYLACGQSVQALELYTQALEWYEQHDDRLNAAVCLSGLGICYKNLGQYDRSLQVLYRALPYLADQAPRFHANVLNTLGNIYSHLGDHDKALAYYEQSLDIVRREGNTSDIAVAVINISSVQCALGRYEQALNSLKDVLDLCESTGDTFYYTTALAVTGGVYRDMGHYDTALDCELRSLELARKADDKRLLQNIQTHLGDIYTSLKRFEQAREEYTAALAIAEQTGIPQAQCELHARLADTLEACGDTTQALVHYRRFTALQQELQDQTRQKAIAEMQALFEVEKAREEARIHRLAKEELRCAYQALEEKHAELSVSNQRLLDMNREKNDFLSIVAHDLKNPLGQILGLSQLLRDDRSLSPDEIAEFSSAIVSSSERMFELITNLLDINAIEQGKLRITPAEFDLADLALRVVQSYEFRAEQKRITLHSVLPREPVSVTADPTLTRQVLDNLLSNAVKYSPQGGTVHVRVSANADTTPHTVRVAIRDTGPGLSPDDQKKLFGKFARLTPQPTGGEHSTGLGLSIVKKLVEAMHGRVWCDSEEGRGSTFTVELPSVQAGTASVPDTGAQSSPQPPEFLRHGPADSVQHEQYG